MEKAQSPPHPGEDASKQQPRPNSLSASNYHTLPPFRVEQPFVEDGDLIDVLCADTETPMLAARSVSTYPTMMVSGKRARCGDPNADAFLGVVFDNAAIIAIADGCNWGPGPSTAARKAMAGAGNYLKQRLDQMTDLPNVGHLLLRAMCEAHAEICRTFQDQYVVATTTVLIGMVVKLFEAEPPIPQWAFLCASVGDCKAWHYRRASNDFKDVTVGNRCVDTRDPGGRLGRYVDGHPDLRNLNLYYTPVEAGDVITLCTDGVYDNLDPAFLGRTPGELGLPYAQWTEIPPENITGVREKFSTSLLRDIVGLGPRGAPSPTSQLISPAHLVNRLVDYALNTTEPMRQWMEANPGKKQPADTRAYPGKLDHTTAISLAVADRRPDHPRQLAAGMGADSAGKLVANGSDSALLDSPRNGDGSPTEASRGAKKKDKERANP